MMKSPAPSDAPPPEGTPAKEASSSDAPTPEPTAHSQPTPAIPDHVLLKQIGGGSYGEVWLARNALGCHRAVKIVYRHNFDHDRPFAREFAGIQKFEPISRSHAGLVDLLQVGRNDAEGYFYYVMELADDVVEAGEKVGKWETEKGATTAGAALSPVADSQSLNPDTYVAKTLRSLLRPNPQPSTFSTQPNARLPLDKCIQLGLSLTNALAYLHGQGLVHRDIKPSNIIFVGGVPKLADVGLVTGMDEARSYVGTEGFIPPEGPGSPQADLYSLGILLYSMSTGKSHQDFPEPLPDLAAQPDHNRWLEFNAIVHKACRPEVGERYQSAEEMHADLLLLKAGKSVRRTHLLERRLKIMTRVAAGIVAVMVLGAIPYFLTIQQARRAKAAAQRAESELRRSDQVEQLLKAMLRSVNPSVALGRDTTLMREILDQTAERVATDLTSQPEIEADLRSLIGTTYFQLTDYAKAEAMYREALRLRKVVFGGTNKLVAASLNDLGNALDMEDRQPEAETLKREALAMRRKLFGNEHPAVANSLASLADTLTDERKLAEAETLQREALAMQRRLLGDAHPDISVSLGNLGRLLRLGGRLAQAEAVYRELLANQRREHESLALADALLDLGGVLWCQGQLAEAETLSQEALAIRRRLLGVEHPSVATALEKLASELYDQGKLAEAEALYRERLQDLRPRLLPGDPRLERALFSLTSHFLKVGKFTEAEPLARESLAISEKQHPDDWQTFNAQSTLGASLLGQKKHAEAERLLLSGCEGMERREEKTADQDRLLCLTVALQRLVRLYEGMERPDQITKWRAEATKCYRWLVEQHREDAERGDLEALNRLARLLATCDCGEIRDGHSALEYAEKAVALTNRRNPLYLDTLAAANAEARQFAKAVSIQEEAIALLEDGKLKEQFTSRLKLYESNSPCRER